jgi:outer membrane protein
MLKRTLLLNSFFLFLLQTLFAQESPILAAYIQKGLTENLSLKTQGFDLEKSYKALEQSRTLFMPQVNFQMQYTLAAGGRSIEFPIGDLLNPVYSTLNQLTRSNNFPSVENAEINFLPNNFHETKVRTTYAILNREIFFNREIKKELISVEQAKINVYKRELVKSIKMAYLQYMQAQQGVEIYNNALALVKENLRVSERLVRNDVALSTQVLKAKVELTKVETQIVEAQNQVKVAATYFNFLLNNPLDAPIETDSSLLFLPNRVLESPETALLNFNEVKTNREELAQIQGGVRALTLQKNMQASYKIPKIGAALDLGFQGFGFRVWDKQAYGLLGLQLELPIYTAGSNKLKTQQTELELKKLQAQTDEVGQQIQLQISVLQTQLASAQEAIKVNDAELLAAKEYYRLTDRRFKEGLALQIEWVDARTQQTTAALKRSLIYFTWLIKKVELERATASYKF